MLLFLKLPRTVSYEGEGTLNSLNAGMTLVGDQKWPRKQTVSQTANSAPHCAAEEGSDARDCHQLCQSVVLDESFRTCCKAGVLLSQ